MQPQDQATVASSLVALLALGVAIWNSWVQRDHARRSVTPHLDFIYGVIEHGPMALHLVNNGLGPARLLSFSLLLDGEAVRPMYSLGLWQSASLRGELSLPGHRNEPRVGELFPAGSRLVLVDFGPEFDLLSSDSEPEQLSRMAADFEQKLSRFDLRVEYESLYGERFQSSWTLRSHGRGR
jgi:hypothetical protein